VSPITIEPHGIFRDGAPVLAKAPTRDEIPVTTDSVQQPIPPSIERILTRFRSLGREEKMQALVQYAKKLEPVPEKFLALDRAAFTVPECQTRVDLFPEYENGKLSFYADVNTRQSPTIAAFLSILFSAVNGQPPQTTLAIPDDFVRTIMDSLGLGTREVGLNAMLARVKRHAEDAARGSDTDAA
jgi:cysteine desulfuration protein SufE